MVLASDGDFSTATIGFFVIPTRTQPGVFHPNHVLEGVFPVRQPASIKLSAASRRDTIERIKL